MAILKCKACGAPLDVKEGQTIIECSYCDLQQTIPRIDDEFKLQMFNQANDLRRQFEFDSAKSFFRAILSQNPDEAEAYWGSCLCKYGIMYVEDQQTFAQVPTFYKMVPQSILSDADYLKACEIAGAASWKYEDEAKKIDALQKKIIEISNSEEPYDVFICYKKTDIDTCAQTLDSKISSQLYTLLIENNYRVFWAERSLPAGCEYEPYIYSALSSAKIMLLLSSDTRYFEATWVKNEWMRFLNMMKTDPNKTMITCYQNMSAEEIPANLRSLQALDMSSTLFSHDLLEQIQRKLPKKKKETDTEMILNAFKSFQATTQNTEAHSLHNREIALSDGVYLGDAIAGKPHGVGTYHMSNGDRYEGGWNVGRMHGEGTFYYSNGDSWSGEWNNGQPWNGSGRYYWKKDNTVYSFEGAYLNGKKNGEGKAYIGDRVAEEGHFSNGVLDGNGTSYLYGKCSGEFKNGRPWNAEGFFKLPDYEAKYNGSWQNGVPHGNGVVIFENGDILKGTFENGLNGTVCWKYKKGIQYDGTIKNGQPSGHGKMSVQKDGFVSYEGEFENGNRCGKGVHYLRSGNRYEGEFKDGTYHGQGTFFYKQGSWSGEWKNGKTWKGKGLILFYDKDGRTTGQFYNGYVVNGKAAGKGIMRFPDGKRFDGEFLNDNYYNGKVYNANNVVIDTYVNGVSQQQRSQAESKRAWNTAAGIFDFISKL